MTHRDPRPDLGLEITLFYHRDRNGTGRLTIRTRDVFGTPIELEPEAFASVLEATARDVRAHVQKADPLAPEMSRHGHKVEALTPNEFVDLWRKGYR